MPPKAIPDKATLADVLDVGCILAVFIIEPEENGMTGFVRNS